MLNLARVLQMVEYTLDQRPLAKQQPIPQPEQTPLHVLLRLRHKLHVTRQQIRRQRGADVPLVSYQFAEEILT